MAVVVKNIGPIDPGPQNQQNTDSTASVTGDVGTVRVIYEGREYVFGPNEAKTFSDDGIGAAVAAADARLRVADTRDGIDRGQGNS